MLDVVPTIRYTSARRGVAQLVAHSVWDAGVVGSNPITPTTSPSFLRLYFQAERARS